ncbi:MAG: hypothetical protein ACE5IQ_01770 [Candidatus Methylomirabilales bacterium]
MTYLLFAALIALGIVVLLMIMANRPHYHKNVTLPQIRVHLHALLKRGYDGGFIIIEDMKSEKFVQYAKYIKDKGNIGLELSFPRASWSETYYEKLKDFLRSQNIPFRVQPVDSETVTEFIDIDCHSNIELALHLVEGIFCNIFHIEDPSFRVRGENISARDELIDS